MASSRPEESEEERALRKKRLELEQDLEDREDFNSAFSATKEFLQARGLTNVRELDVIGNRELVAHLKKIVDDIVKNAS